MQNFRIWASFSLFFIQIFCIDSMVTHNNLILRQTVVLMDNSAGESLLLYNINESSYWSNPNL